MSKRGDRVPQPARTDGWQPRYGTTEAAHGWDELCRVAPNETHAAYAAICRAPVERTDRRHRLKAKLATGVYQHRTYAQWQYEVTAGGRVWYLVDEERRTLWFMKASPRHPKTTE
jgi:hypothetical protein